MLNRPGTVAAALTLVMLSACGGGSDGSNSPVPVTGSGTVGTGTGTGTGGGSPTDTTPPTAPTQVAAQAASASAVTVSWTASTDSGGSVAGYDVFRNGTMIASNVTGTTYTDNTVQASTSYTYAISALDTAGNDSAMSSTVAVTTPADNSGPVQTVPTTGTAYPGYTYTLPTQRPYISLAQYAQASVSSAPVTRLKGQVDDVVNVTNSLNSNATYNDLVNALSNNHYAYSSVDSVVMYKLTGNTAYIDQAIRMVDLYVASENALIAGGHAPQIAGDDYLNIGEFLGQLALAYDYGYARMTATQRSNWSTFAEQTLTNLWNPSAASWGGHSMPWAGWAIDDPGDNYYYSFLQATQLWALASQSSSWISFLQTHKYTELVPYFSILVGGGSREGTGYGTALGDLFEDYLYWKGSTGEDLSGYSSHARDTIDYWVHASTPDFEYFAPIGDQARSSMTYMFDYQRKLVLEGVALSPTSSQGMHGSWWLAHAKVTDGGGGWVTGMMRYNFDYRYDLIGAAGTQQAPTALMYSSAGTGALFARSDWTTSASWMHTNVGYYDQSHAHQDQGSFSFYHNGWLSVTSNVYSNSGINQDTGVENVLRFDSGGQPVPQNNSVSTKAFSDSGDVLQINADITPAYSQNASKVSSMTRQFTYTRSQNNLVIHDKCTVAASVTPVFQLHLPVAPVKQSDGSYLAGHLHIQVQLPVAANLTESVVNMTSVSSDFSGGYRMELRGPANSCEFVVSLTAQ